MLLDTDHRCEGWGVGATGHQLRADCLNCQRRTAPRPAGQVSYVEPSPEFPCPNHVPATGGKTGWPAPDLAQDDHRGLFTWFAHRLGARQLVRDKVKEIGDV